MRQRYGRGAERQRGGLPVAVFLAGDVDGGVCARIDDDHINADGSQDVGQEAIAEALLNGLSADAGAFAGESPAVLRRVQPRAL